LGPLKNSLGGRSTSTSTIRGNEAETASTTTAAPTPSTSSTDDIAASESMLSPPPTEVKPGILIVTLHEGKGFSLPQQHAQAFAQAMAQANSMAGSMSYGSFRPGTASSRGSGQVAGSYTRPQSGGGINAAPTNHGRYSSRYLPYALLDFDKVQVFVDAVSGTPENPYWAGDNTQYKFDVSRVTELSVQLYLRNPNARPGSGRNDDIFLGACKVKPIFREVHDKKEKVSGEQDAGQHGSEWLNLTFGTGSVLIGVRFVENREKALKSEDFELLKLVGKGSFGKVMQVRYVMQSVNTKKLPLLTSS
jgi:serum/glucocorticoid-regulated kinase 2